ncbi:hypothetical protein [Candidatus Tisiphia endosymbiont of Hybos culiciformis]|uniref:hypothetical protein n=1 Tax=Candidatus Tisiphia endosymbiont of Hybos culiciformis TaxID=3139331 RepID=UPI003CCA8DF7
MSRLQQANEIAEKVGFSPFAIGRKYLREEMITKVRNLLGTCRIDAEKCQRGINGLYEFDATIVMPIGLGDKEHNYCKLSFLATAGI